MPLRLSGQEKLEQQSSSIATHREKTAHGSSSKVVHWVSGFEVAYSAPAECVSQLNSRNKMDGGNPHLPTASASNDNYRDGEPQDTEDILQKPIVIGRVLEHASSSQEMLRSMKLSGPLGSYHRGTALRMVSDYLTDLKTLSMSFDENIQRRVEENRSFLSELTEANQREPNSPLTWQERSKLTEMLKDYQVALSASLEDQDDEDMPDVDNDVEFKAEEDVADGVSLGLYEAKCSSSDIMERLTSALEYCETQVREFKDQLGVVWVYRHQCTNLVETLEPTAESNFERCHRVLDALRTLAEVDGDGVSLSDRYNLSVQICFESLIALARKFQLVLELLRMCASENLHRTALELADLPPPPSMSRRWSEFSLTIRNCEWSMDFVEFAFYTLEKLLAGSTNIFQDVSYRWCEEKNRMVLQTQGKLGRQDSRLEKSVLDVSKELEAKDLDDLITKLRGLGESASGSKWRLSGILSRAAYNRAHVAKFLSEKLSGPIPHARYLPWTFRVDPSTLKFREYLDSGGAGMVGKYSWFGENVAVKNVRSPGLTRHKFEEEAAILATVQHPNVVRLVGCGFIEKNMTGQLVMELMEHDLRTVIEKRVAEGGPGARPFAPSVAIDIIQQIAQAMKHLKDHKILHRDLKAKNILVNIIKPPTTGGCLDVSNVLPFWHKDETYVAKLADFGLAKCRPHSSWVRTRMAGTTGWRAPEVFHVQDTEVTQEYKWPADVYSFGMTCYEILTGNLPFANLPNQSIHENVLAGKRPDGLDELEVPELLKALVKKCWATKPEDRPTFDDIVKSLWECRVQAVVPIFVRYIGVSRSPSVIERHDSSSSISRSGSNF